MWDESRPIYKEAKSEHYKQLKTVTKKKWWKLSPLCFCLPLLWHLSFQTKIAHSCLLLIMLLAVQRPTLTLMIPALSMDSLLSCSSRPLSALNRSILEWRSLTWLSPLIWTQINRSTAITARCAKKCSSREIKLSNAWLTTSCQILSISKFRIRIRIRKVHE